MEQEQLNKEYNSLPPRSSIHKTKEQTKNTKRKLNGLHIIVTAFILLIVFTTGFFYLQPEKEQKEDGIPINTPNFEVTPALDSQEVPETNNDALLVEENNALLITENDELLNSDQLIEEIHEIQPGENLYRISLKYYKSGSYVDALAKYNGLTDAGDIHVGLKLVIPSKEILEQ